MKIKRLILLYYIIVALIALIGLTAIIITIDYHKYNYNSKETSYDDNDILLSIHSYDGKSESTFFVKSLGHAWISIENNTTKDICLNDIIIKPSEVLTISVWAITSHYVVTYNLEAMFIKEMNRYDNHHSISYPISEDDLDKISTYINENNKWTIIKNCTYFSINLWNSIVSKEYKLPTQIISYTPSKLIKAIKEYSNYEVNKPLDNYNEAFIIKKDIREVLDIC